MDTRKICLLGDFAVGKTNLVARFVNNRFSERYVTSIGVKVDTKEVPVGDGRYLKLAIWDVAGADTPTGLFLRYLSGAAGYLLVVDGTRADSLDRALQLREAVNDKFRVLPFVGLINKSDLRERQEIDDGRLERLRAEGTWLRSNARSGENVEQAFEALVGMTEGFR